MLEISNELKRIADILGLDYIRGSSMDDSNIQAHYNKFVKPTLFYIGFGESTNNNPNGTIDYEEPLSRHTSVIYVLVRKSSTDSTAESMDNQLAITRKLCSFIISKFETPRPPETYKLIAEGKFDDMLIGHRMEVVLTVPASGCP